MITRQGGQNDHERLLRNNVGPINPYHSDGKFPGQVK